MIGSPAVIAAELLLTGLTGAVPVTRIFTPPADGFYSVAVAVELVSTNNVGSIPTTITFTNSTGRANTILLGTNALSGNVDGNSNRLLHLKGGTPLSIFTAPTGLTGTVYNLAVSVVNP